MHGPLKIIHIFTLFFTFFTRRLTAPSFSKNTPIFGRTLQNLGLTQPPKN